MNHKDHEDHEVHKGLFFLLVIFVIFVVLFSSGAAQQSAPVRSVWDGVYTAEQAKRGESLYAQHCSSCHGSTFEGGEMAPPLAGGAFNANWNGLSLGDLAERIRISMPQNNPGSLSRQQYVDILATMLGGGEFPQGKTELPREVDALKQIAFESAKRP
jgi:mono/diheme cytochrome c family protein